MKSESNERVHLPVMAREVLEVLAPARGEKFLDLTVGAGGHAFEIASRLGPGGMLVGVDLDEEILEIAKQRLSGPGLAKCRLFQANFRDASGVLADAGLARVDGILLDLGVSSLQLGSAERGFSFAQDGPLDMRMDCSHAGRTAADIVNYAPEAELERIFREYGEERYARRIAEAVVRKRRDGRITRTRELAEIVRRACPRPSRRIHPATRVFQALRIEVNDELENLKRVLEVAPGILEPGGRIAVTAFHSLEDRIVKEDFRSRARQGLYTLIVKKPLRPAEAEVASNPRSRSAKLRAARRSAL